MPKEMKSLTINVATVNPKEILSRACSISFVCFSSHVDQSEYGVLLAFCCNRPILLFNERDCLRRRAKSFVVKEGVLFYRGDKEGGDFHVIKKIIFEL